MKDGTVRKMTDGQRSDLITTMAGAIPADFLFDEAQAIVGQKGPFVAEIRAAFSRRRLNVVPADDVWFDLEVDYDISPMEVVSSAGHDPSGWKYIGPKLSGKRIIRAKLVRLGNVCDLEEAKKKADKLGYRLVEEQARDSFKTRFSKPDGSGPVAFGGSEWQGPLGDSDVAYLNDLRDEWSSNFNWSGNDFNDNWRWLVVSK